MLEPWRSYRPHHSLIHVAAPPIRSILTKIKVIAQHHLMSEGVETVVR
jgi:hypothetical protein